MTARHALLNKCSLIEQDDANYITFFITFGRYKLYEDATVSALIDRYGDGSSGTCVQPQELPVVMIVGAGRGPIVRAALQVAHRSVCFLCNRVCIPLQCSHHSFVSGCAPLWHFNSHFCTGQKPKCGYNSEKFDSYRRMGRLGDCCQQRHAPLASAVSGRHNGASLARASIAQSSNTPSDIGIIGIVWRQ